MKEIKTWDDIVEKSKLYRKKPIGVKAVELKEDVIIYTREGTLKGYKGDFLICGIKGEIYPCGREIFFETYDEIAETTGESNGS